MVGKKFDVENILNELESTPTYKKVDINEDEIFNSHLQFCKQFKIEVNEKDRNLPHIFMMPKFHKNPISFRFISNIVCFVVVLLFSYYVTLC